MEVQLGDYLVKVEVIRKNNKNIYFRFKEDGILYVSASRLVSLKAIEKMIKENEKSILRMYEHNKMQIDNASQFYYLGEPHTIVYDGETKKTIIEDGMIITKDEKSFEKWYKSEALRIFEERIKAQVINFNDIPEFTWKIRKMTTRWGVNNVTKKNITLNSELLKKDVTLIDYVIVHELCHFYEANHSSRFWAQVAKRYPYYKLARKRLRVE